MNDVVDAGNLQARDAKHAAEIGARIALVDAAQIELKALIGDCEAKGATPAMCQRISGLISALRLARGGSGQSVQAVDLKLKRLMSANQRGVFDRWSDLLHPWTDPFEIAPIAPPPPPRPKMVVSTNADPLIAYPETLSAVQALGFDKGTAHILILKADGGSDLWDRYSKCEYDRQARQSFNARKPTSINLTI
jgi:hypothetical protein